MTRGALLQMRTVEEVAQQLGLKVSTVRMWILKRRIAYHKVGGKAVRISQDEIDRILEESAVPARGQK
jgi:excisionase family DNA binding protein